jgi:hypothetical protein
MSQVVVHTRNPSPEAGDHKFEAILGYVARSCLKTPKGK